MMSDTEPSTRRRRARAVAGCLLLVLVSACSTTATPSPTPSLSASPDDVVPSQPAVGSVPFPLVVPTGFTSDGLPVGLELMGRPFAEPTLISIAAGYEAHTNHRILPPATPPL